MTYQELLDRLQSLSPDKLNQNVFVNIFQDEYVPVVDTDSIDDSDMGEKHIVLITNDSMLSWGL